MQPINYMLDVAQPLQMALAGYQQGRGMRAQEEGMQQQRRLMEMQEIEFQQQQQALQAQQQRAAEVQDMMGQFAEDLEAGNVDMGYLNRLVIAVPEMAEMAQQMYQQTTEPQQRGMLDRNLRILNLARNAPDQVGAELERLAQAYENAGDMRQAEAARITKQQYDMNPKAFEAGLLVDTIMNPLYDEETMGELIRPTQAEAVSPEGKILADYNAGAFGPPGSPEAMRIRDLALEGRPDQGFGVRFDEQGNIVYVGTGAGDVAKTPSGMVRVADPNSPTGTRLVPEPGSDVEKQRKATVANADRTIATLTEFITDPSIKSRYGVRLPIAVPGTAAADAQALIDQVKGQIFLEAYESLKGGGQITEIEGRQATAAMSRLQDQNIRYETAIKAAQTLLEIAQKARDRALGVDVSEPAMAGTPTITTDDEYDALPVGTIYFDDEGIRRRKQ